MQIRTNLTRWSAGLLALMLTLGMLAGCAPTPTPSPATDEPAEARPTPTVAVESPQGEPAGEEAAPLSGPYSEPPEVVIDPEKYYVATLRTELGDIVIELFADKAPVTVNNFVFLAREGFYDDTTFYGVAPGEFAWAGDPTGLGEGGPGYVFASEIHPELSHDRLGRVSMVNNAPDTNGSQFLITMGPLLMVDNSFPIFGQLIEGLDVLLSLTPRNPYAAETPGDRIEAVLIEELDSPPVSRLPAPEEIIVPAEIVGRQGLYLRRPEMEIDPEREYVATIETEKGEIVVALNAEVAPITVNNFVFLAQRGFYDGLTFHRVEPNFVIQGGDPLGSGQGGPGYVLPPEIELTHEQGVIAMARLGDQNNPRRMSSGSQFYLTLAPAHHLDGAYTVFGELLEGMDVVQSIAIGDVIERVTIIQE